MNSYQDNQKSSVKMISNIRSGDDIGISIDELRDAFAYDKETGIFTWNVKTGYNARLLGKTAGSRMRDGYMRITLRGTFILCHRAAWAYHYGEWPSIQIDHKNMDKSDNRISNLRLATPSQNTANQGITKRNRHGVKGVTPIKNGKWQAAIGVNGKVHYLGSFNSKEEAANRHAEASIEAFGEFAQVGGAL